MCIALLSGEETFRRIGMAVRVDIISAVVWRGAAPCSGPARDSVIYNGWNFYAGNFAVLGCIIAGYS